MLPEKPMNAARRVVARLAVVDENDAQTIASKKNRAGQTGRAAADDHAVVRGVVVRGHAWPLRAGFRPTAVLPRAAAGEARHRAIHADRHVARRDRILLAGALQPDDHRVHAGAVGEGNVEAEAAVV